MDNGNKIHYTKRGRLAPMRKAFAKPVLRKFCKTHGHTPWTIGWYRHPGVCIFFVSLTGECGCSRISHEIDGSDVKYPEKPCYGGLQMMYYCVKCIKAGGYGPIGAEE